MPLIPPTVYVYESVAFIGAVAVTVASRLIWQPLTVWVRVTDTICGAGSVAGGVVVGFGGQSLWRLCRVTLCSCGVSTAGLRSSGW